MSYSSIACAVRSLRVHRTHTSHTQREKSRIVCMKHTEFFNIFIHSLDGHHTLDTGITSLRTIKTDHKWAYTMPSGHRSTSPINKLHGKASKHSAQVAPCPTISIFDGGCETCEQEEDTRSNWVPLLPTVVPHHCYSRYQREIDLTEDEKRGGGREGGFRVNI